METIFAALISGIFFVTSGVIQVVVHRQNKATNELTNGLGHEIHAKVDALASDVAGIKIDVTGIKADLAGIKGDTRAQDERLRDLEEA